MDIIGPKNTMSFDPSLVARINNQAIRNLSSHNFESSIRDLATALKADHELLAALSSSSTSESSCSNETSSQHRPRRITLSSFPTSLLSIDNWMEAASSDTGRSSRFPTMMTEEGGRRTSYTATSANNGFGQNGRGQHQDSLYIYNHPIYIPNEVTAVLYEAGRWPESERTVDDELISQLLKLAAIAITFNLALAFQQQAAAAAVLARRTTMTMLSSEEAKSFINIRLKRSLKLFRQSYDVCRKTYQNWHHFSNDGTRISCTTLFALAALNNVAALYKSLGDPETASAGFQDLLSSLMMCTVLETDSSKVSRYTAFFHNTAKLSYPDCSICAGSA